MDDQQASQPTAYQQQHSSHHIVIKREGGDGISNLQLLHDLTHALQGADTRRNQWQTQDILDKSHFMKHGFYTSRIAVDKEQREEVLETMVNLAGSIILATHLQTNHL